MNIRKIRMRHGVSQLDLAYGAKISRFRLFLIEKGHKELTESEITRVRDYLTKVGTAQAGGKK